MPQLEARRSERIDYRADVELLARSTGAEAPHSMLAHALDLGSGGMRIATQEAMPVGAEVTCRMTLDGRPAAFPGRVVWAREPHADEANNAHGMGICFESLGAYEAGLLRHVVERSTAGYRPLELHFAGIDQPVIARARPHADGLRLSAALPIFARGTELSFQLDEEGPHFSGHIGNAALFEENGTRRIEIDVEIVGEGDGDNVRFRRRARYGYADEIAAEERHAVEAARAASAGLAPPARPLSATLRTSHAPRTPVLPMFVAALVGGTLAWSAASRLAEPKSPVQAEFVARPLPQAQAQAQAPAPAATAAPATAAPAAPAMSSAPEPAAPAPAAPATTVAASTTENSNATSAPGDVAPAADAQTTSHVPRLPESLVEANGIRIRIPFEGNLSGMHSTIWADPAALAIDLPRGSTTLEAGRYPIDDGGITDLRVNKSAHKLLLRVRLTSPVARYAITAEHGVLEAQLQRGRVSRTQH